MGKRFTLFRLLGFRVQIELGWLLLAVWLVWSLASSLFPSTYRGLSKAVYWWMGLAGAVGLFASIIFHELSHSVVARHYGLRIRGITLFIFGGVAELERDPPSPKPEFLMALAGPVASAVLALGCWGLRHAAQYADLPTSAVAVLAYLASVNGSLAAFNLLPAFPLDGGRVLRSALWRWRGNIRWATRVAAWIGTLLGNLMIGAGTLILFLGDLVTSVWVVVIGFYVKSASRTSYRQLSIRLLLEDEPVERFMQADPVTVPPSMSVAELAEHYVQRYHSEALPVVEGARLVGCVSLRAVARMPRAEWSRRTVADLTKSCSAEDTIGESGNALQALTQMSRSGSGRLVVVDGDQFVGIVTLKDLLEFLSLRTRLGRGMPRS